MYLVNYLYVLPDCTSLNALRPAWASVIILLLYKLMYFVHLIYNNIWKSVKTNIHLIYSCYPYIHGYNSIIHHNL